MTSTAAVSTTEATGCFTSGFFTGARLGLALATVRFATFAFADLETLRALPRLAELPLCSFARFCTFDPFLRLAMIHPQFHWRSATIQPSTSRQTIKRELSTDRSFEPVPCSTTVTRITATQGINWFAVVAPSSIGNGAVSSHLGSLIATPFFTHRHGVNLSSNRTVGSIAKFARLPTPLTARLSIRP